MGKLIVLPGNKITASGPRPIVTPEKHEEIKMRIAKIEKLLDELLILANSVDIHAPKR